MNKDIYFLEICNTISKMSSCLSKQVGAILVRDNMIISTGYNGTPKGVLNCNEGGCKRCLDRKNNIISEGEKLNDCICLHAEENCIIQAAYNGISTKDSILYCTHEPCSECLKLLINAGISIIKYSNSYDCIRNPLILKMFKMEKI